LHRVIVLILGLVICLAPRSVFAQDEAQGILRVSSSVKGAMVHIDYEQAGEAPMTRYLSPGKHTVRVSADGYDPFVRRVTVQVDVTTQIVANLKPGGGTVEFFFQPLGANIEISGTEVGPSPIRLDSVQPGEHAWHVTAPQRIPQQGSFTFVKGGNVLFAGELASSVGVLWVDSEPAGAQVWVDDQERGVTPLRLSELPPGPHSVRLQFEAKAIAVKTFDNTDGELVHIQANLGETGADVTVQSASEAAIVRINGQTLGTGKKVKFFLERGTYDLRVDAAGFSPLSERVEVPPVGAVVYLVDLATEGDGMSSSLVVAKPLIARWTTWTIAGGAVVGAGAVVGIVAVVAQPDPLPSGDVVVPLP
jgi:hypothetical protein